MSQKSSLATAGLVLGILGVLFSFIPIINNLAFIMGILALAFGIICLVKKTSKTTAIVSIVLAILAMFITIQAQTATSNALKEVASDFSNSMNELTNNLENDLNTATGGNTDKVLQDYFDVKIGNFEIIEQEYGLNDTKLLITVTNKSNDKKSGSIQIEAIDSDGKRIDTDTVYISSLNAGQSQDLEAFIFVTSDKIEQFKNAEFKILSASAY